ncbi:tricorn protease [Bacteroidia bacterium]|nr:tricorn protease [Bacteroidia bacterium]
MFENMKKLFLLLLIAPFLTHAQDSLFFATQPTISPDGGTIYFCYDGGIWGVSSTGGTAARVTAMTGYQTSPKVSPDGKWLAFTSDEQGNFNVYITPVAGGNIRQLTFHEAQDYVASWSADSKYVYFESNRYNDVTTYKVSIEGGTPERLFPGYFNMIMNLVENPVDHTFYFNDNSEASNYPTRKGYKGENNPDIKSWNPERKEFKQLTTYIGKDLWPSVDKAGNLYWATDEANGEYNLAKLENGKPRILTSFPTAIQRPEVSQNGKKVVFTKDYIVHLYDVETGQTTVPPIKVFESSKPAIAYSYQTEGKITANEVSPDGKKFAFVSRGHLFVSDVKGLFIQPIPTDPKERVVEVVWAKDNKTLYYTRTRNGWYNLYKISAEKPHTELSLYTPDKMVKNLTISNDHSKIAFVTGSGSLEALTTKDDKVEKLADNEFWSFQGYNMSFSPDDKYLAYTAMNLFERDIFIYDFQSKKTTNLTNSATPENTPAWSIDGKYLYITANRTSASFPRGGRGNLFRIKLDYTDTPFTTDKYNDLFNTDTTKKTDKAINISFNQDNLQRRWEPIESRGSQDGVLVLKSGDKNYLVYTSTHEGSAGTYVQELLDFDQKPAKKISDLTTPSSLSYSGKDLYALQGGNVYSVNLDAATAKKIDLKQSFAQNNGNEFSQMFYEVWALLAENFYDPTHHGKDWTAKRDQYARFLPHLKSRRDLRTMITDLLGELNSSHLGFTSNGDEEKKATTMKTYTTGLLFENDAPYKVASILKNSPAYTTDSKIQPGDELVAVNGQAVDKKINREYYFSSPANAPEITLTFSREGKKTDVTLHTGAASTISPALYTKWEDDCRQRVTEKTGGRVAYHHMRDMGDNSLNSFLIDMATDAVHKDALILDLRYNNGGNVHDEVLEYLSRKHHFTWKYRDYQINTHPNVVPGDKPLIVLVNERSLSDAEVTSNGIKTLGLAKIVGTETYRWIIFTSGSSLVDGSFCRLPAWGCYNLKGEDMEATGVTPDVYVKNTFVDRLTGNDPQLDKAIELILSSM